MKAFSKLDLRSFRHSWLALCSCLMIKDSEPVCVALLMSVSLDAPILVNSSMLRNASLHDNAIILALTTQHIFWKLFGLFQQLLFLSNSPAWSVSQNSARAYPVASLPLATQPWKFICVDASHSVNDLRALGILRCVWLLSGLCLQDIWMCVQHCDLNFSAWSCFACSFLLELIQVWFCLWFISLNVSPLGMKNHFFIFIFCDYVQQSR